MSAESENIWYSPEFQRRWWSWHKVWHQNPWNWVSANSDSKIYKNLKRGRILQKYTSTREIGFCIRMLCLKKYCTSFLKMIEIWNDVRIYNIPVNSRNVLTRKNAARATKRGPPCKREGASERSWREDHSNVTARAKARKGGAWHHGSRAAALQRPQRCPFQRAAASPPTALSGGCGSAELASGAWHIQMFESQLGSVKVAATSVDKITSEGRKKTATKKSKQQKIEV